MLLIPEFFTRNIVESHSTYTHSVHLCSVKLTKPCPRSLVTVSRYPRSLVTVPRYQRGCPTHLASHTITCSVFLAIRLPMVLLKKLASRGLSGGSWSRKSYRRFSRLSSSPSRSLICGTSQVRSSQAVFGYLKGHSPSTGCEIRLLQLSGNCVSKLVLRSRHMSGLARYLSGEEYALLFLRNKFNSQRPRRWLNHLAEGI